MRHRDQDRSAHDEILYGHTRPETDKERSERELAREYNKMTIGPDGFKHLPGTEFPSRAGANLLDRRTPPIGGASAPPIEPQQKPLIDLFNYADADAAQ